jgi:hypothetical protein
MTFLLFKRLAKAWRGACCEIDGFGIISGGRLPACSPLSAPLREFLALMCGPTTMICIAYKAEGISLCVCSLVPSL